MKKILLTAVAATMLSAPAFADYRDMSAAANNLDYARTSAYAAEEGINENDFEFMMVFENEAGEMLYAPSSRKGAVKFKPTKHPKGYGSFDIGSRKWDTLDNVWRAAYRAGYTFVEAVDRPNK